jgi:hypothetical protein
VANPQSLGESTPSQYQANSSQRHIVKTSGGTLVLFESIDGVLKYKTSADNGVNWDAGWETVFTPTTYLYSFDAYLDSNDDIHLAFYHFTSNQKLYYCKLTNDGDDTFTKGSDILLTAGVDNQTPKFGIRTNGDYWIVSRENTYYSTNSGASWTQVATPASSSYCVGLVSYGSNMLMFSVQGGSIYSFEYTDSWQAGVEIDSGFTNSVYGLGVVKISDTNIWLIGRTSSGVKVYHYTGSWDSGELLSNNSADTNSSLCLVDSKPVAIWLDDDGGQKDVVYRQYNGSTWESAVSITSDATVESYVTSINTDDTTLFVIYFAGASPSTIMTYYVSLVVDNSINVDETLYLADNNQLKVSKEVLDVLETLYLGDVNEIDYNIEFFTVNETLYLADENTLNIPKETLSVLETLYLEDTNAINVNEQVLYGTRILSYNPLILLTGLDPIKLVHVDISTPTIPVSTVYVVDSITNAKDIVLNDTTDYFYLGGADGVVVKIEKANLSNQTVIDTSDTDDFQKMTSLDTFKKTFGSTDDSSGEIIMIDESTIDSLNTDIRWSKLITNTISCFVNTILGQKINLDVRFSKKSESKIKTDIRWLKYDYDDLTQYPIDYSDIQVKINGTDLAPLNDVDLKSIVITHTKGDYSTASFILHRKHDNPNYDNQGNASQITNQNSVLIYINDVLEFNGTIQNFNVDSEAESITVNARMNEPSDNRQTKSIPLASVNEHLNLYHCLVNNISIENPVLDTQAIIVNENGLYWSGSEWVGDLNEATVFSSHASAQATIDSSLSAYTSQQVWPDNYISSPDYYKGIQVNLGTQISQQVEQYSSFESTSKLATKIEKGTFKSKQNWNYFWFASFENFITGTSATSSRYLGTSLGSLFSDTWKLIGASYKCQKQLENKETDQGFYYVGSAPFKQISVQNGELITKDKWVDKNDGLYRVKDASYNYIQYAKDIASLEYSKLKTINNVVLPVISSQIELTLDAYYFYNLKLLTRVNLSNTTASNIYNNANGFPVSIKTISINTNSMKVSIQGDNQLSGEEIDEIDRNYPDMNSSEYITELDEHKNYSKFDPTIWGYVD